MGDYDNDGYLDIVASTWNNIYYIYGYHNNGNGTFNSTPSITLQRPGRNIVLGDYDNDGQIDIGTICYGGTPSFYRNLGGSACDANPVLPLPSLYLAEPAIALADYDNDGDIDMVVSGLDPKIIFAFSKTKKRRWALQTPRPCRRGRWV